MNKKCINSALSCEAYSSFEGMSSDHRIVTAKIRLSLRRNAVQTTKTAHYDSPLINNRDICNKYTITLKKISYTSRDIRNSYSEWRIWELHQCPHGSSSRMNTNQTKSKTLAVKKKRDHEKTSSLCNRKTPTNANVRKLKRARRELTNAYQKEQTECIQYRINKIRDSVEDKQSRIARQTVNEEGSRKSTARAKLKATSKEERLHLRTEHFKNLLGKFPKVTDEPITKIISNQLDIKVGQFMQELDVVLRKIKMWRAAGLDEIPSEVWKTRKFDHILVRYCNTVNNQNIIDIYGQRAASSFFPRRVTSE